MALQAICLEHHRRDATTSRAMPPAHKCTLGDTMHQHESLFSARDEGSAADSGLEKQLHSN